EDRSADARFSMMVDLYSLPDDFPGYPAGRALADPYERAYYLEQALAQELSDPRFLPYLQVHEFEALVLSAPQQIGLLIEGRGREIQDLIEECQDFPNPERINDGQHTHPKARIQKHLPEYDENVHGPLITEVIGLPTLRVQCPHFGEWLARLE